MPRTFRSPRIELISGPWGGHYVQGEGRYPQNMTLEFSDGLIKGDGIDGIGPFYIQGEYRVEEEDVRLGWIKTYEGAHSVLYLGNLAGRRIVGTWNIHGWGDAFSISPLEKDAKGIR